MQKFFLFSVCAVLVCAITICKAQQPSPTDDFKPGQSVYVIAVKTSTPFQLLLYEKAFSDKIFVMNGVVQSPSSGSILVDRTLAIRGQSTAVFVNRQTLDRAQKEFTTLEESASPQQIVISNDPLLRAKLEEEFKKQKKFTIAASAEAADIVFFAFSHYPTALMEFSGRRSSGDILTRVWKTYEDSPYSTEEISAIGFGLLNSEYQQVRKDLNGLYDAARWKHEVSSITRPAFVKSHPAQQGAATALVKQFHEDVLKKKKILESRPTPKLAQAKSENANTSSEKAKGPDPATPTQSSQDEATIKLDTTLVVAPVVVLDRDGKFIPDLTQRDFHIFEDNVEQEIDHFGSIEAPFDVVLLLDTSSSIRLKGEEMQKAAIAFVEQLRPQDRVMVVSANSEVYINTEFTNDRKELHRAIYAASSRSGTRLYDSVDLVLTERLRQIKGRKAIVLFTDGVDTESRLADARSTLELAEESDALVYTIHYDTSRDNVEKPLLVNINGRTVDVRNQLPNESLTGSEAYRFGAKYLRDLAERTGARLFQSENINSASQAFSQIARELREQYSLSYYPTNTAHDGSYRRIRITVNRPNVAVRARPGYRAATNSSPSKN